MSSISRYQDIAYPGYQDINIFCRFNSDYSSNLLHMTYLLAAERSGAAA